MNNTRYLKSSTTFLGFFSLLFLVGASRPLFGQNTVEGVLLDSLGREPVPFANVFFLANQDRGVITNEQGEFRLKFGLEERSDTLVFSALGYRPVKRAILDLQGGRGQVYLQETSLALPQVTVLSDEGLRKIVREALERLPLQYGSRNTLMRAYFREYSITDSTYSEMMEAFVTINDGKFRYPPDQSEIFLNEFRRSLDERDLPSELEKGYTNGLYNIYDRFPYVLSRVANLFKRQSDSFLDNYRFFNNGEYQDGKDTLIRVGFLFAKHPAYQTRGEKGPFRAGEMTIRKSDFGILRLRQGDDKDNSYSEINYQKIGEKYFPARIQLVYSFTYEDGKRFYLNSRQIHVLKVLSPEERKAFRSKRGRSIRREYGLRAIKYNYNEAFWKENEMLVRIPAPRALQVDLTRRGDLEQQFYQTARRKRRGN